MLRPEPFQSRVRFEKIGAVFASNSSDDRTVSDPKRTLDPDSSLVFWSVPTTNPAISCRLDDLAAGVD